MYYESAYITFQQPFALIINISVNLPVNQLSLEHQNVGGSLTPPFSSLHRFGPLLLLADIHDMRRTASMQLHTQHRIQTEIRGIERQYDSVLVSTPYQSLIHSFQHIHTYVHTPIHTSLLKTHPQESEQTFPKTIVATDAAFAASNLAEKNNESDTLC